MIIEMMGLPGAGKTRISKEVSLMLKERTSREVLLRDCVKIRQEKHVYQMLKAKKYSRYDKLLGKVYAALRAANKNIRLDELVEINIKKSEIYYREHYSYLMSGIYSSPVLIELLNCSKKLGDDFFFHRLHMFLEILELEKNIEARDIAILDEGLLQRQVLTNITLWMNNITPSKSFNRNFDISHADFYIFLDVPVEIAINSYEERGPRKIVEASGDKVRFFQLAREELLSSLDLLSRNKFIIINRDADLDVLCEALQMKLLV